MRRREALAAIAALGAWPGLVELRAQPTKPARIAALFNGTQAVEKPTLEAFMRGLREHGYADGRNVVLDIRYGEGRLERLPAIVAELVARRPDVVLLQGSQAIWAGKRATSTIPIVMVSVADPAGQGLIRSLAKPGGNITGLAILTEEDVAKRLELLREVFPRAATFGYLTNLSNPAMPAIWRQVEVSAKKIGVAVQLYNATSADALDARLADAAQQRAAALMIEADVLLSTSRRKIADFLLQHRIPSMWASPLAAGDGGLMSYGANFTEHWTKSVAYIERILKGARPADLPVEQPALFQLIINQRTARAIGVAFPAVILNRADRIIE
jgi:putative ABC transport system substrate-binding protein